MSAYYYYRHHHHHHRVCVTDSDALVLLSMFRSFLLLCSYFTFTPKFALAFPLWKQARLAWNFITTVFPLIEGPGLACIRTILLDPRLLLQEIRYVQTGFNLWSITFSAMWPTLLGILIKRFSQRLVIRYSSELFINLSLQTHDVTAARDVCCRADNYVSIFGSEIPPFQRRQNLFSLENHASWHYGYY